MKPADKMWEMKGDMSGGAAVMFAMKAIGKLKPDVNVTGIIPTAENSPDANAQRPGDIFFAKNGKSIMVDNTDAEGRLILTDGLALASEEKPTHILDIATLTGAVVRALGLSIAGVMGNNPRLIQSVIRSGENHGESFWELPLPEEYKELLKTPCADLNNIGGPVAGALTAGLFLQEFVPEGMPWAHLDIAGPFIRDKDWKYYEAGAIGFGTKTLVDLAERFQEYLALTKLCSIIIAKPKNVMSSRWGLFAAGSPRHSTFLTDALALVGQHGVYCRSAAAAAISRDGCAAGHAAD